MKPRQQGRRLIVMRPVRIVAVAIAAVGTVAVAMVVAGCASAGPAKAGSGSVASASDVSSPVPMVSIGSPTPSDAAERSRVATVTELVRGLLAEVVVALPAGSKELRALPVGNPPGLFDTGDDFIDVADSWLVPGTGDAVLAYIQQHAPAGLTWDGGIRDAARWYQAPAGPVDEGAVVQYAVTPDPAGGVDLRVDVRDTWQPLRPPLEQIPATVTGATLVRRTDLRESPSPPVTIHVGADVASHIAALLNALPSEADGPPDAGGGPERTVTVTFEGDPSNTQYAVTGGFYNTVTVNAPSQALPTLSRAGDLDTYLEGLF
ncbi:MAG TPA: hypothetical protein VK662_16555 [Acidothermaceae bacterium]|nr:hypothetical protein [Acidothermaceae bacterium]